VFGNRGGGRGRGRELPYKNDVVLVVPFRLEVKYAVTLFSLEWTVAGFFTVTFGYTN